MFSLLIPAVFIFPVLWSCHDERRENDRSLQKFDTAGKNPADHHANGGEYKGVGGFRSVASVFNGRLDSYDSLDRKFSGTAKQALIKQMKNGTDDFYGYIRQLKGKFIMAIGGDDKLARDTTQHQAKLANDFFERDKTAARLPAQLQQLKTCLLDNATSGNMLLEINRLGAPVIGQTGTSAYFRDLAPMAVITILNSFESDTRAIETNILSVYIKQ